MTEDEKVPRTADEFVEALGLEGEAHVLGRKAASYWWRLAHGEDVEIPPDLKAEMLRVDLIREEGGRVFAIYDEDYLGLDIHMKLLEIDGLVVSEEKSV